MIKRKFLFFIICVVVILGACGSQNSTANSKETNENALSWEEIEIAPEVSLMYATQFRMQKLDKYTLITIADADRFLLLEEEAIIPKGIPEEVVPLQKPLEKVDMIASNGFDPVVTIDALDHISFSGVKAENMALPKVLKALENGEITYAGKYSAPDYELLIAGDCSLAIVNTMIYHNPEVKEKLEGLEIPVLVERSSYEGHPLGRLEWMKLYGALFDKEEIADQLFHEMEEEMLAIENRAKEMTEAKTVAFFHVNSNGVINVRKPGDYIVKLIEMAGGEYVLKNYIVEEENSLSTMNMQMEDFYLYAKDADILIYNSTIVGEVLSLEELIEKNEVFADFKAVKNQMVYCTDRNFFQETSGMGSLVEDLNLLFSGKEYEKFTYLKRMKE